MALELIRNLIELNAIFERMAQPIEAAFEPEPAPCLWAPYEPDANGVTYL